MSKLLESLLLPVKSGSDAARVEAGARLRSVGLPTTRDEAWKYTSLRALDAREFHVAGSAAGTPDVDPALWTLPGIDGPRLVFVNGRFRADLSQAGRLPEGLSIQTGDVPTGDAAHSEGASNVFTQLNYLLARDGCILRVADGQSIAEPVHVVHIGVAAHTDLAWHLRLRVELGQGSAMSVFEHFLHDGPHAHLANVHCSYALAPSAALQLLQLQDESDSATLLRHSEFSIAESAYLDLSAIDLGAGLSRHELCVELAGPGACLESRAAFVLRGRQHGETRLDIRHAAPDTRCQVICRGVADQRARGVFHGAITIERGADGSDASLSTKNLLLSANAEIDAQPVLVINADEVKAAHGATVGQLDERALFYLRSRGVSESEARTMLTSAFCTIALDNLPEQLRSHLQAQLVAHLPGFATVDDI